MKDIDLIKQGFPINRSIESFQIFEDVDEDEFLSKPLSDENILSASPLHGYLRVFGWFMQLVYHLQSGEERWTPSSSKIHQSMKFVRGFLWEKLNIKIDCPSPQGGTSTTGNVARNCFQRVDDSKRTSING